MPVGCNMYSCSSGGTLAQLKYLEIKQLMNRWSAQQKKGKLADAEIKGLVKKWYDRRTEGDLNKAVINREMRAMEAKLVKYNLLFRLGGLHTFSITYIHTHFDTTCYIGIKSNIQQKKVNSKLVALPLPRPPPKEQQH